jgi:nicotinate-nucleotide pyrophosphorylase (carboxylating)
MNTFLLDPVLRAFLQEDLEHGDVTSEAIFSINEKGSASLRTRTSVITAGIETVAAQVFQSLDRDLRCENMAPDGIELHPGACLMQITGSVRSILQAERVALNLVQRLCGIATLTRRYVEAVQDLTTIITDTRKTTPGLRFLEKYAVRVGGGRNHRYSLSDGVLIKDNHIAACGSITEAVQRVRVVVPHTLAVEVEVESLEQVKECLHCGVEIIMLDNMDLPRLRQAVALIGGRALVEASGGVTLRTVRGIAETGVDIISVGALTHSAPASDLGLDWE